MWKTRSSTMTTGEGGERHLVELDQDVDVMLRAHSDNFGHLRNVGLIVLAFYGLNAFSESTESNRSTVQA